MDKKETTDLLSKVRQSKYSILLQDIEILLFMFSVLMSAITIATSTEEDFIENIVMFLVACAIVIFAVYKFKYTATVLAGMQVLVFTVYKLYKANAHLMEISWRAYLWVIIPFLMTGSLLFFLQNNYKIEQLTELVMNQMSEMALINTVTGLYNLKAMYIDLERQMSYSERRGDKICLAMIELRYGPEMKSILSTKNYQAMIQRFSHIVEDSLRLEDRCYSIDEDGSIGVILSCDKAGAMIVKKRMKANVLKAEAFEGITNRALKVDIRMAFLEYDKEVIKNAIEFKQKTESELQYDV